MILLRPRGASVSGILVEKDTSFICPEMKIHFLRSELKNSALGSRGLLLKLITDIRINSVS